jgi:Bax protein
MKLKEKSGSATYMLSGRATPVIAGPGVLTERVARPPAFKKVLGAGCVLDRRSMQFFCLLAAVGLFVIGCSVSLNDRDGRVSENGNGVENPKDSPASFWRQPKKDIVSQRRLLSQESDRQNPVQYRSPVSSAALISTLVQAGLWDNDLSNEVPLLLIDVFTADLASLDIELKKRVFLRSLLPVVMVAIEEVRSERERFQFILEKFDNEPSEIFFPRRDIAWQRQLLPDEVRFVRELTRKYRHTNAAQLLKRIDVVPVSLVLAQGAIESSWGTSRFASLGNNLFGMWTWGEAGIVPLGREEGKSHKIAAYNSIVESVRAYILTINRHSAYEHLRELRLQTSDPLLLSQGLLNYSERREAYVEDLRKVISCNRLNEFDKYSLTSI